MKKGTITALIIAGILIFTGAVLLVLGLSFADTGTRETVLVAREVTLTENFDSILIDTKDCDITFVPYNGTADPYIVLREKEKTRHNVWVENGTLKIEMTDTREWTDHIGIFQTDWESMSVQVHLPQKQYETIRIHTDTGDIKIPKVLSAKEILLRSATGKIWCEGVNVQTLDSMTSTGDIEIFGSGPVGTVNVTSSTGDIKLSHLDGEEIHLKNSTGETELESVTARILTSHSSTGDVSLELTVAQDYMQIFTTTGDVEMESCDAGSVNIETDTGDVSGYFLTPKYFNTHSDTGNVTVPEGREGGECRIQTDTGDIHFR